MRVVPASTTIATRLAWGLVRNPSPGNLWRRIGLPIATGLAVISVLLVAGLVRSHVRQTDRESARSPQYVTAESPDAASAPLRMDISYDSVGADQWPVHWVDLLRPDAPVPPGLSRWPGPGRFAVSPALAEAIRVDPVLAARYGAFTVIGPQGVRHGAEMFAYGQRPQGAPLRSDAALFAGFGGGVATETLPVFPVAVGGLILIGVPVLLLLGAGAAMAAPVRDERTVLLHWLGADRSIATQIGAIESFLIASPGVVVAGVGWAVVAPRLVRLPIIAARPNPGDMAVAAWIVLLVIALILGVCALGGARQGLRGVQHVGPRPTRATKPSRIGVIALSLSAAVALWGLYSPGGRNGQIFAYLSTLLFLVGLPTLLPHLVDRFGAIIAEGKTTALFLAGRRLQSDPTGASRPLAGLCAFVFIALACAGFVNVTQQDVPPPPPSDPVVEAALVSYRNPGPSGLEGFRQALAGDVVARFDQATATIATTCSEINFLLGDGACLPDGTMSEDTKDRIARAAGLDPRFAPALHLVDSLSDDGTGSGVVMVLSSPLDDAFIGRVKTVAFETLAVPEVTSTESNALQPSPIWTWIEAGLVAGGTLLGVGLVLMLVDRYIASMSHHRPLIRLGVSQVRLRNFELGQFALVYLVAVGAAFVAGLANIWIMGQGRDVGAPVSAIAFIFAATIGAGLLSALAIAGAFLATTAQSSRTPIGPETRL